jgi:hypothetical protein
MLCNIHCFASTTEAARTRLTVTSHGRCMSCYTSAAKSYNKRVYDLRHVTSKERHKRCCRKFKWASSTAKCHHITTGLKCGKNGHLTCTVLHGHLKHLDRNSNTVQSKSCPGGGGKEANISCPIHVYREP